MNGAEFVWKPWLELRACPRRRPSFVRLHDAPLSDHPAAHPAGAAIFNAGITSASTGGFS